MLVLVVVVVCVCVFVCLMFRPFPPEILLQKITSNVNSYTHEMQRDDSPEKILMLVKVEGRRRRG